MPAARRRMMMLLLPLSVTLLLAIAGASASTPAAAAAPPAGAGAGAEAVVRGAVYNETLAMKAAVFSSVAYGQPVGTKPPPWRACTVEIESPCTACASIDIDHHHHHHHLNSSSRRTWRRASSTTTRARPCSRASESSRYQQHTTDE